MTNVFLDAFVLAFGCQASLFPRALSFVLRDLLEFVY